MMDRDLTPRLPQGRPSTPAASLTGPGRAASRRLPVLFPRLPYANLQVAGRPHVPVIDDPRAFLAQFPKGAVIDEVQAVPELPSYLQGVIDDNTMYL